MTINRPTVTNRNHQVTLCELRTSSYDVTRGRLPVDGIAAGHCSVAMCYRSESGHGETRRRRRVDTAATYGA